MCWGSTRGRRRFLVYIGASTSEVSSGGINVDEPSHAQTSSKMLFFPQTHGADRLGSN
jgi:hypothetical protein